MSDERLRALERDAIAGDFSARAQLLGERKRIQQRSVLPCMRCDIPGSGTSGIHAACPDCGGSGHAPFGNAVKLAAYLGDPAARLVEGWPEEVEPDETWTGAGLGGQFVEGTLSPWKTCAGYEKGVLMLPDWLHHITHYGEMVMARAAIASAKAVVAASRERSPYHPIERCACDTCHWIRATLAAAEIWADCSCSACLEDWRLASIEALRVTATARWLPRALQRDHDIDAILAAAREVQGTTPLSAQAIRAAIREALVPWLLSSPVA